VPSLVSFSVLLPTPPLGSLALLGVPLIVGAVSAARRVVPLAAESLEGLATNRADLLDKRLTLDDHVLPNFGHHRLSQRRLY
jgi:hypothetical protein